MYALSEKEQKWECLKLILNSKQQKLILKTYSKSNSSRKHYCKCNIDRSYNDDDKEQLD